MSIAAYSFTKCIAGKKNVCIIINFSILFINIVRKKESGYVALFSNNMYANYLDALFI